MKATGIVRRIDDLGRVVIPKEIRRTMRIREGDPLEIYTQNGNEIVFKKYSPMGEISNLAFQFVQVLNKTTELPAVICDRERVIAAAGIPKKEILERRITNELENTLIERKTYIIEKTDQILQPFEGVEKNALIAVPILSAGDLGGAVILLEGGNSNEEAVQKQEPLVNQEQKNKVISESQIKLAQAAALFLGLQIEA